MHNFTDLIHVSSLPFNRSLLSCSLFSNKSDSNRQRQQRGDKENQNLHLLFPSAPASVFHGFTWYFFLDELIWHPKKKWPTNAFYQALSILIKLYHFGRHWVTRLWALRQHRGWVQVIEAIHHKAQCHLHPTQNFWSNYLPQVPLQTTLPTCSPLWPSLISSLFHSILLLNHFWVHSKLWLLIKCHSSDAGWKG